MNSHQKNRHVLTIEDSENTKTIVLEQTSYSLGRHSSNDIVLTSQRVSRHHATLLRRTDVKNNDYSYWILDGDLQGRRSRNGIYVKGKKCLVHELKDGDIVDFSNELKIKYKVESDREEYFEGERSDDTILILQSEKPEYIDEKYDFCVRNFSDFSPQATVDIDLEGNIKYLNKAASKITEYLSENIEKSYIVKDLVDSIDEKNIELVRDIELNGRRFIQQAHYIAELKLIRTYLIDKIPVSRDSNNFQKNRSAYDVIFSQSRDGIIIINSNTRKIEKINDVGCNILGYESGYLIDFCFKEIILEEEKIEVILKQISREKKGYNQKIFLIKASGNIIKVDSYIDLVKDETEDIFILIIKNDRENKSLSPNTKVANLPNKETFSKHLVRAIEGAEEKEELLALLLIKTDGIFETKDERKSENLILLLSKFIERVEACLHPEDTLAYWNKGTFAILMPGIKTVEEVARISQRIINSLETNFSIQEDKIRVQAKIGISIYPQDGDNQEKLLKKCHIALSQIEDKNSLKYNFHSSTMNFQASVQLKLESALKLALEQDEFLLYYQPQVEVETGEIKGIEALLRWEHPELGLVSPASFLKLAEQTKLIIPIGEWTLKTACKQSKVWHSQGMKQVPISVNLSSAQFKESNLAEVVKNILAQTELEPNLLELEVSARTVLQDIEYAGNMLSQLQNIGVHISIDNFASAFASLEKYQKVPVDKIKIDRDFVRDLNNDPKDLAIVSAITSLGEGFGLRIVAEGVETEPQIKLLQSKKCQQMQGFWFSRPLRAEEVVEMLPFEGNNTNQTASI